MATSDLLEVPGSVAALTITVASLASSTTYVGRQSTEIDNSSTKYPLIYVCVSIKLGTSPSANTCVYVFGIRNNADSTPIRDDGAGASDAAWTRKSAGFLTRQDGSPSILYAGASPATGDVLSGIFLFPNPGPKWAVGVSHNTGVNLNSTGGNHVVSYFPSRIQAQ